LESLLIHESEVDTIFPELIQALAPHAITLKVCEKLHARFQDQNPDLMPATEIDWFTEYLGPELSVKCISSLAEAIDHINHYGSHHTDGIVTQHHSRAMQFLRAVDSSSVLINASTRFADGFEYGLGAEIGISTDKFHARGPVGLHGLTCEKYVVFGQGQCR
jgi:glutamate-5-semialdehyde dehydrogenase